MHSTEVNEGIISHVLYTVFRSRTGGMECGKEGPRRERKSKAMNSISKVEQDVAPAGDTYLPAYSGDVPEPGFLFKWQVQLAWPDVGFLSHGVSYWGACRI